MMKKRKIYGWIVIAVALCLMLFGDFGLTDRYIMVAIKFFAMAVLAVGVVMVGA